MALRAIVVALAVFVTALAGAAAAPASTVTSDGRTFTFEAAPLEANQVEVSLVNGNLRFRDRGAALTPGGTCEFSRDDVVECPVQTGGPLPDRVDIQLGDGSDGVTIRGVWRNVTAIGGEGDDSIRFSRSGADSDRKGAVAAGGEGNDRIEEAERAEGGPGDDALLGSQYSYTEETLRGGEGNDTLDGGGGLDEVHGGPGDDALVDAGGWGEGKLYGDEGNDTLAATGPRSVIEGGDGDDTIRSGAPVADGGGGNDTMIGGTVLRGGEGDDRLIGGDIQYGGRSGFHANRLEGGPGQDQLAGGKMNDALDGGPGADSHSGGEGEDTLSYATRTEGATIDLRDAGGGVPLGEEGDSAAADVERVEGSEGDDEIMLGSVPLVVDGLSGEDVIVGGPGPDRIVGGGDSDVILAGAGDDAIDGGVDTYRAPGERESKKVLGDDVIDAGPGNDTIIGRRGDDYVVGGSGNDAIDLRETTGTNYSPIIQFSGADQAFCGAGNDSVEADYADDFSLDCEATSEGTPRWRGTKVYSGKPLRVTVRCAWAERRACKGVGRLRTAAGRAATGGNPESDQTRFAAPQKCRTKPGVTLARSGFRIRGGRVNYVWFKLSGTGERLLRKNGCIAVQAVFEFTDGDGRPWMATRSLALKRPGVSVPSPPRR